MLARPTDRNGDILPVAVPGDLLSGTEAAASALRDHLRLFPGDWWENAEKGNPGKAEDDPGAQSRTPERWLPR